jgi:hypothetical protein
MLDLLCGSGCIRKVKTKIHEHSLPAWKTQEAEHVLRQGGKATATAATASTVAMLLLLTMQPLHKRELMRERA